ncbi:MAG TPA: hypothetical protein VF450_18805 [Noviherbaspirillum sp.]|jgi:F-type H+-transporting ATPase subunit epsilon
MNGFSLEFCGGSEIQRFEEVMQFIAGDDSGSFGILPHHEHTIAVMRYGMARFVEASGTWRYAAMPGGVVRFAGNAMTVVAARYFIGTDRAALADRLAAEMTREDSDLRSMRQTLAGIERTLIRRLNELRLSAQGGNVR